jgi:hypothetical protein
MTSGASPSVTVLMAVYNGERYVREAVDSILGQSYRDFEFIIVDDGSTDRSRALIAEYTDPRIRLLVNEANQGLAVALNRGIASAAGTLVARQDADDVSEPNRLERQVAYLTRHPEVTVVGSWYRKINPEGHDIGLRRLPCDPLDIRWAMLFHCPLIHSAVMFRRAVIARDGPPYDPRFAYAQDYDLWSRIARVSLAANLAEPLVRVRTNPWSMTATYGERTREGPQISISNINRLTGWGGPPELLERRLAAMEGLVLGADPAATIDDLAGVIPEILALHTAFSGAEHLPVLVTRARGATLRRHMARRMLALSRRRSRPPADARRALREAWRLSRAALVSPDALRLAAAGLGWPPRRGRRIAP